MVFDFRREKLSLSEALSYFIFQLEGMCRATCANTNFCFIGILSREAVTFVFAFGSLQQAFPFNYIFSIIFEILYIFGQCYSELLLMFYELSFE